MLKQRRVSYQILNQGVVNDSSLCWMNILYYSDDDNIEDENLFEDDHFEVDSEVPDSQGLDEQENDASAGVCIIFVF